MSLTAEIIIAGAVQRRGKRQFCCSATLQAALDIASGLVQQAQMQASGIVTVRRPQPDR